MQGLEYIFAVPCLISMNNYIFDVEKETNHIVEWIRAFFEANGKDCKAVLGISGGKDSSVAATLCVKALGKDRVFGVLMPDRKQDDIDVSHALCKFLDIDYKVIDIGEAKEALIRQLDNPSRQTMINIAPRIRMTTVYALSQSMNGRVVNTCNLSEDYIGYSTRYGDSVGDFSPLSHYTVQEVKAIGRYLGLPSMFTEKVPSDGLCGKSDEDNLGFTYAELDEYIRTGHIEDSEHQKLIDYKYKMNKFKLELMPSCTNDIDVYINK